MRRLLLPILVLAAAIVADRLGWRERLSPSLLLGLSRGLPALVFFLAWRFQRGRVAFAAVLLAAAAEALRRDLPVLPETLAAALAVLLPLDLAVLGLAREWPVASVAGLWRFGVLGAQAAAVAALARPELDAVRAALHGPIAGWPGAAGLPAAGVVSFLAAGAALAVGVLRRPWPLEAGLLGTLAATFLVLTRQHALDYYVGTAAIVLGVSLVESAFSLAFEDGLTGLPARRALEEAVAHLGGAYAIAMVDLDHFKKVNDRHGHEVGDQVLRSVATRLARVGGGGRAFRYGGEEFSVIFAGKTAAQARPYLEELRGAVAGAPFTVRSPGRPKKKPEGARGRGGGVKELRVTVSIGVSERGARNRAPEEVMKAADKALYRAKRAGRNRVTVGR